MFFPLGDDNSGVRSMPWVVSSLIAAYAAAGWPIWPGSWQERMAASPIWPKSAALWRDLSSCS
jgi:hypothetical protein